MFAHLNETLLKVVVIIAILVMFVVLYLTGILFVLGVTSYPYIFLHKFAALLIIGLLGVHAWLRRCTIKRLLQESFAILTNTHIRHEDNIEFLIHNTKNQSFHELCLWFQWDSAWLQAELLKNHVHIHRVEDTLKTIAKANKKDMFEIFLLMMKLHVEKKNPSPVYKSSCSSL
ncbi:MAG: hypothetical protein JW802_07470 [Campylobacterales bacterium]|nr:hypothetical protein [Campylobacterales bacterium]